MVRFSQTLDDKHSKSREKPYVQVRENPYHVYEDRQSYSVQNQDEFYKQPSRQQRYPEEDFMHKKMKLSMKDLFMKENLSSLIIQNLN